MIEEIINRIMEEYFNPTEKLVVVWSLSEAMAPEKKPPQPAKKRKKAA
jgi:hypothetical protein